MAKSNTRDADLRQALTARRREMGLEVRGRIKDGRSQEPNGVQDIVDASDESSRQAIDMTVLQMQAATLTRIDEALGRLDAGQYGFCFECSRTISAARLKALPFAVRCLACEDKREQTHRRETQATARGATPFSHVTS